VKGVSEEEGCKEDITKSGRSVREASKGKERRNRGKIFTNKYSRDQTV
jgi:hypothetical protein